MRLSAVIVDDSDVNLLLFKHLIARLEDIEAICFKASLDGLNWCEAHGADIVVVDYMMPAPDGIEFIRRFRQMRGMSDVPVIMVTANNLVETRYQALQAGATDFLTKPIDKNEFGARVRNMAALRRSQKLIADRAALLASEVAAATKTIVERELETIFRLSKAAEYRDPETGRHLLRMAHYSRLIAAGLKLAPEEQQLIFVAAPMHDIGKVGIRDEVLLKPGPLSGEELTEMRLHASIGHDILCGSTSLVLQAAAVIAVSHHEKFDGSGYPYGLAGEEIHLHGRIVALADVFDALTSSRPYKNAWGMDQAAAYIREHSGTHFDPACVAVFFDAWDQVLEIRHNYGDKIDGAS